MRTITKRYTNGEVTVIWQPHMCEHSTKCFQGLPQVFDPRVRPWVKAEGASTEEIIQQVRQCPSGALSFVMNTAEQSLSITDIPKEQGMEQETEKAPEMPQFKAEVIKGGPLRLHGPFVVQHRDGRTEVKERASFCRCGHSKNKPFCDGTHKTIGWDQDEVVSAE